MVYIHHRGQIAMSVIRPFQQHRYIDKRFPSLLSTRRVPSAHGGLAGGIVICRIWEPKPSQSLACTSHPLPAKQNPVSKKHTLPLPNAARCNATFHPAKTFHPSPSPLRSPRLSASLNLLALASNRLVRNLSSSALSSSRSKGILWVVSGAGQKSGTAKRCSRLVPK